MIFKTMRITAVVLLYMVFAFSAYMCVQATRRPAPRDPLAMADRSFWSRLSGLIVEDERFARLVLKRGFPKNGAELAAVYMYFEALSDVKYLDSISSIRTGRDVYGYNLIIEERKDEFIVYGRTYTEEKYKSSYARYPKFCMQRFNRSGSEQDGPRRARE